MLLDRRRHERFSLRPMYTWIALRTPADADFIHEGHAYDISESGLRFELDHPVAPGTPVDLRIDIPAPADTRPEDREVRVRATIVWLGDDEEPGPARLAAVFHGFATPADRERLLRMLGSGRFARAA